MSALDSNQYLYKIPNIEKNWIDIRWDATREVRIVNSWDYFDADEMDWGLGLLKRSGIIQYTIHNTFSIYSTRYIEKYLHFILFKLQDIVVQLPSLFLRLCLHEINRMKGPCQDPIIQCQMLLCFRSNSFYSTMLNQINMH